jgi:hypothetical protein
VNERYLIPGFVSTGFDRFSGLIDKRSFIYYGRCHRKLVS